MYRLFVILGVILFCVGAICLLDKIQNMRVMIFAFRDWREDIFKAIKFFIEKNIIKKTRKNIIVYPAVIVLIVCLLWLIVFLLGTINKGGLEIIHNSRQLYLV